MSTPLTFYLQIEAIGKTEFLRSFLHPEEIASQVSPLHIFDHQGTVLVWEIPQELESPLGSWFYLFIFVICGHWKFKCWFSDAFEPVAVSWVRANPAALGGGERAGHDNTQTLLHLHQSVHL